MLLLEVFCRQPGIDSICRQVQRQLLRNESARFYHHRTRKCTPPRKLRRESTVGIRRLSGFEWQMNDASHFTGGYLLAPSFSPALFGSALGNTCKVAKCQVVVVKVNATSLFKEIKNRG